MKSRKCQEKNQEEFWKNLEEFWKKFERILEKFEKNYFFGLKNEEKKLLCIGSTFFKHDFSKSSFNKERPTEVRDGTVSSAEWVPHTSSAIFNGVGFVSGQAPSRRHCTVKSKLSGSCSLAYSAWKSSLTSRLATTSCSMAWSLHS